MVEGGGLENRFPVFRNGGSNPSPSALILLKINQLGNRVEIHVSKIVTKILNCKASGGVYFALIET